MNMIIPSYEFNMKEKAPFESRIKDIKSIEVKNRKN